MGRSIFLGDLRLGAVNSAANSADSVVGSPVSPSVDAVKVVGRSIVGSEVKESKPKAKLGKRSCCGG